MNRNSLLVLSMVVLVALLSIDCSKKVTKVQPVPQDVQPKVEQVNNIQPKAGDSFTAQNNDDHIKELFGPVYFDYDKASILNSESQKLEKIASFLNENKRVRVLIEGNCDERGSSEYNMGLGENRARAVQHWLSAYGIASSRLEITSYGKEQPALSGCSDDDCNAKNRRDEWKILEK
jgi:peptidoglycan-associated lipoprotein